MSWDILGEMRQAGLRPRAVAICTPGKKNERTSRSLLAAGVLTIDHRPGTPFPARLLVGLDVMLFLDRCDQAAKLRPLFLKHGWPERVRVWCECSKQLTFMPVPCEEKG